MEEQLINQISNVGFPIAAFLLMWSFATRTLKKNTDALVRLKEAIVILSSKRRR